MPDEFGGIELEDEFGGIAVDDAPASTPRYNDELIAALPEREKKKLELASERARLQGEDYNAKKAEDFFKFAETPLIPPEDILASPEARQTLTPQERGISQGVAETVSGLSSPQNLALLAIGPAGRIGAKVAGGLFGYEMAKAQPELARAAGAASVEGTEEEKALANTRLGINTVLGGLTLAAPFKGAGAPVAPPEILATIEKAKDTGLNKSAAAAEEAVVKGENASSKPGPAEVHGDVRSQPGEGEAQVPITESGEGVQPRELQKPAEVLPQEKVKLVAAIRSPSGKIYTGERHPFALANAMDEIRGTGGTKAGEMAAELADAEQGFVDVSTGRFLTRSEAAKAMGATGELTSEQIPESELKSNLSQYQSLKELRELPGTATTQEAMALGAKVPKESIPQLEALAKAAGEEAQKIIAEVDAMKNPTTEDLTRMSVAVNKAQLLNEAVEAAKGGKPAILAREAPTTESVPAGSKSVEPAVRTYYVAGETGPKRGGVQYISETPELAAQYAEGGKYGRPGVAVRPITAQLKTFDASTAAPEVVEKIIGKTNLKYIEPDGQLNFYAFEHDPLIQSRLREAGYDSIRISEGAENGISIAVLDKNKLVSMGGATPGSLPSKPTIGELIPPRPAAGLPPSVPPVPMPPKPAPPSSAPFFQRFKQNLTGTLGTMAGKTLPRITQLGQQAGEAGARYISSAIAAPYQARIFARDVTTGLNLDPVKFGAALSEDNLRSIEGSTFSFVGKGKPFATEAEYQAYLKKPEVQEAIKRHISNWDNVIEPMFREAQQIDPTVTLPTRGKQTGARVNLAAIMEGEPVPPGTVYSSGRGNILNTLRKKSPFGIKATGTGEAYAANYNDIIANSFHKQLEIANKNAFDNALVEQGLAVIDDPGQHPVLGGEETVGFPLKRKTIVVPEQGAFSQNKTIYVRKSIAREYRNASNLDDNPYRDFIATRIANAANQAALAGLTDATVHVTNLSTGLAQLPVSTLHPIADAFLSAAGRLDVPVAAAKVIAKGAPEVARAALQKSKLLQKVTPDVVVKSIEDAFWKNQTQLAELAEIGAMKGQHGSSGLPVMRQMSDVIQWYDRSARAVLDDAYQDLASRGIVENSETARREFVNQVGQYNKRAQGAIVRLSRDLGTGPFVTAGRAFNVLGVRGATLNPGVKATSVPNAVLLRANMAAKWMGTFAFVALANYLLTGKTGGRPGTPIGSIDSGKNDEQGRMKSFSVINLTGQGRALRVTGLRGGLEAKQKGLPSAVAADAAERDLVNSWVAPFAGPVVKAGFVAASGYPPAIKVGRASKVVPPGQSQTVEDVKTAVEEANPIVAGAVKSQEPGRTWEELVKTQLPRFTMQTKQPEKMIADYPTIVRRAQANAFMEDVIHRARYIEKTDDRKKYIRESLDKLDRSDRPHAELMLRFRKINY